VRTAEGTVLSKQDMLVLFEEAVLPHLDAAHNLARWLIRQEQDAEDLVQESYLRAFKSFEGFRGGDGRAWILTIVRNTCYTWLQRGRWKALTTPFDEEIHSPETDAVNPEALFLGHAGREQLTRAIEELPVEFREALVLRELEGLSYKEIADIAGIPLGTVMSRLARARKILEKSLAGGMNKEPLK
jgi:RNA polymerase sigma-70 factor, ECF subfamily